MDEAMGGLTFPAVGLGTMRQHGRDCQDLVEAALALGYRHLDTARHYGNEEAVGAGMRRSSVPRDQILLATKIWHDDLDPTRVREATHESLARLGTDYVDVLLVHWPSKTVPIADTLAAFGALRDDGTVRAIGVANFPLTLLDAVAATPGLVCDQVEYHPYLSQDRLLRRVRDHGLVLTAYCPLGRGAVLENEVVRTVAADCGHSVPQVILRWLVQQDRVIAIPGTSSVAHLQENLAVDDFSLDDSQMATIGSLARGDRVVDPPHAPDWEDDRATSP